VVEGSEIAARMCRESSRSNRVGNRGEELAGWRSEVAAAGPEGGTQQRSGRFLRAPASVKQSGLGADFGVIRFLRQQGAGAWFVWSCSLGTRGGLVGRRRLAVGWGVGSPLLSMRGRPLLQQAGFGGDLCWLVVRVVRSKARQSERRALLGIGIQLAPKPSHARRSESHEGSVENSKKKGSGRLGRLHS
jgi:hypothetical protein